MTTHTRARIVVGALMAASLAVPFAASAAVLSETQVAKVILLLQTLNADADTIARVREALVPPPPAPPLCVNIIRDLAVGSSGEDVATLQKALAREGFSTPASATFDAATAVAAKALQEKYASDVLSPLGLTRGTGYVGASTRALLNRRYGCAAPATTLSTFSVDEAATTTPAVAVTYGSLDYNSDRKVDQADVQFLLDVAVSAKLCPAGKLCDLDSDSRVAPKDALILANYIGSTAKPGTLDYTNDGKLDTSDVTELSGLLASGQACPEGKSCDVNGNSAFNEEDVTLLTTYVR